MSIDYYAGLLAGSTRIEAFRKAIEEAVRPGDRVVDVGTGLGTFALFAARSGAAAVWAVESRPVVHVARWIARQNDLHDSVRFVRGRVPEVDLPGPVDVLVFEDFPVRLFDQRTHRMLRTIAADHVEPTTRVVPRSARLCLAPLRSSDLGGWLFPVEGERYGMDWSLLRPHLANQPRSTSLPEEVVVAEPLVGSELSIVPPPDPEAMDVSGRWRLAEGGPIHALALWFDLEVGEGRWISNAPGPETQPWGQLVLPLDPPVPVSSGGSLRARARFERLPDGAPGWLVWSAETAEGSASGHEFAAAPAALDDLYQDGAETVAGASAPAAVPREGGGARSDSGAPLEPGSVDGGSGDTAD